MPAGTNKHDGGYLFIDGNGRCAERPKERVDELHVFVLPVLEQRFNTRVSVHRHLACQVRLFGSISWITDSGKQERKPQ